MSDGIKEFILWAKENGIESFQLGELSVKFAPYASQAKIEVIQDLTEEDLKKRKEKEEEDLLFYSAR